MKDNFDKIFDSKDFDLFEPNEGHFSRFESKLNANKSKSKIRILNWAWLSVAASILIIFGFWLGNNNQNNGLELADISPEMQETQDFFEVTLKKEIAQIQKVKNPENQIIIDDAFDQLQILEDSYQQLKFELKNSDEDKRVIFAMISNYQQRIEILQNLMENLESIEELKNQTINNELNKA